MRMLLIAAAMGTIGVFASCSGGGGENGNGNGGVNVYEGLDAPVIGEILCSESSCCFGRCWGNNDVLCVTQDAQEISRSLEGDFPSDCEVFVFPEWFYNHDCFILTDGTVGPGHPSGAGNPLNAGNEWREETSTLYLFVQCFCDRDSSSYSSEYSSNRLFLFNGCEEPLVHVDWSLEPTEMPSEFVSCDNPCRTCQPSCAGRECGSDGCGGSCGSCIGSQTCNASGQCVSSSSTDNCSACLSSCRGLPSCCTGCGCLCEDECGQCF